MGRTKKKPGYDQNRIMEQFQNCIVEAYTSGMIDGSGISLRQVSEEFGITLMKTRKILITAGVYHTENSEKINSMRDHGDGTQRISNLWVTVSSGICDDTAGTSDDRELY